MKGIKYLFPKNADAVGLLGYMVIANNQIHSYQLDELNYYLSKCHVLLQNTGLNAILDGKEDAISFEQALHAYGGEKLAVKKSLFFYCQFWHMWMLVWMRKKKKFYVR